MSVHEMVDRLVLSLRYPDGSHFDESPVEMEELRSLVSQAGVRGGYLVAWQVGGLALSFPGEALPDVTELLGDPCCERMQAGLASGEVTIVAELGHAAALALGQALTESAVLSAMAQPGEVLVAPSVVELAPNLLTIGSRRGTWRGRRWRGLLLYRNNPWLPPPAETVGRIRFQASVDVKPDRQSLEVGKLCVVSAPSGAGGSRYLDALVGDCPRVLRLSPAAPGEPLGALRRALSRDSSWFRRGSANGTLPPALERLLSGAGLSPDAAHALLRLWATADLSQQSAIVAIDEASRIDVDTLSVVASSAPDTFAVVVRVGDERLLPRALEALPVQDQIALDLLDESQAVELVDSLTGHAMPGPVAKRWARRGAGLPLGVTEALLAAVECGELLWDNDMLLAPSRIEGRGGPQDAAYWIRQRLERLDSAERTVLEIVGLLGGETDAQELAWLADNALALGRSLADVTRQLVSRRWIRRTGDRILGLVSATHRDVLLASMPPDRRVRWHAAIVSMATSLDRALACGIAAVHSLFSGQEDQVQTFAHRAALLLRANGREDTAAAFDRLGEQLDDKPLRARGLIPDFLGDRPNVGLDTDPATLAGSTPPKAALAPNSGLPRKNSRSATAAESLDAVGGSALGGPIKNVREHDKSQPVERSPETSLVWARAEANATGQLSSRAPSDSDEPPAPGVTGEAMATLTSALPAVRVRPGTPAWQWPTERPGRLPNLAPRSCRQHLAESLDVARDQRLEEALPLVLKALAAAREDGDSRGEQACLKALAALSRAAGDVAAAGVWEAQLECENAE